MQELPGADWKKGMEPGARLRARIIYVDAAAKRVCLSLLPHLVAGHVDSGLPPVNTLYEVCFSPVNKGKCHCVSSRGNSLVYLLLLHAEFCEPTRIAGLLANIVLASSFETAKQNAAAPLAALAKVCHCALLQNAVVRRVDNALGLLLELPASAGTPPEATADSPDAAAPAAAAAATTKATTNGKQQGKGGKKKGRQQGAGQPAATAAAVGGQAAGSAAGYAHISAVSDTRVEKLDKVNCQACCMLPRVALVAGRSMHIPCARVRA